MAEPTMEQWRDRLLARLSQRQTLITRRRRYYDGRHPFPTAPDKTTDLYRRLAALGITNLTALVVDTVADRLIPNDLRVGPDEQANLGFWRDFWLANSLDADSLPVHTDSLKCGWGDVLVWPDVDDPDLVSVSVEDPADVIVAYRPGSRRQRVAALKCWRTDPDDPASDLNATVWTPGEVRTWPKKHGATMWGKPVEYGSGPNPLGAVPVVEFPCRPSSDGCVHPEISDSAITLQDRINKTGFDAVVAAEFGAFPQRYTIGVEVEMEAVDVNGQKVMRPKNPLQYGPQRAWALKQAGDKQASVGQLDPFPTTDLLRQIDTWTMQFASVTQTPVFHLLASAPNIGAEFAARIQAAHERKIGAHQTVFSGRWADVARLWFAAKGEEPPADIEVGWKPSDATPVERADQASKYAAAGFTAEYIARQLGDSPGEIERQAGETPPAADTPTAA